MKLRFASAVTAALLSFAAVAPAYAFEPIAAADAPNPDGLVTIKASDVAAGVSVVWGGEELQPDGHQHEFSVMGLSILDVGVAKIDAAGEVRLKQLANFEGACTAFSAGATVAGGGGWTFLRNAKGVELKLKASEGYVSALPPKA